MTKGQRAMAVDGVAVEAVVFGFRQNGVGGLRRRFIPAPRPRCPSGTLLLFLPVPPQHEPPLLAELTARSTAKTDFRDQYAHARDMQADALFDEALEIADDVSGDWSTDKDGKKVLDHEHVQRSRLRVDTRKWAAGKMAPKRYGDKIQHTGDGGGPIRVRPDLSKLTDKELNVLERILGRASDAG